jgi:hypothetical protein
MSQVEGIKVPLTSKCNIIRNNSKTFFNITIRCNNTVTKTISNRMESRSSKTSIINSSSRYQPSITISKVSIGLLIPIIDN